MLYLSLAYVKWPLSFFLSAVPSVLSLDVYDGIFLVPWWAQVHIFIGFVAFYWILAPILYYTNVRSPYSSPNQSHLLLSLGILPTSPSHQMNLLTVLAKPTTSLVYSFQMTHSTKLLTTSIPHFTSQLRML